ncbi:hypothetical protein LH128_11461 [Sphingomonas sp. LH128]|jgi:hypothetical protein|uniref:Uncharacterized protein n=2 Tax=Novosphingobium resinovorum TaxID=158500 RepID=A0A031K5L4_9SPHN|nr:hypothetical protein LH128_11461 [Sphingomonas sp. LH128]EZP83867.1 hypothetical protein BV97_01058 [Novosphingobium resinovorum]
MSASLCGVDSGDTKDDMSFASALLYPFLLLLPAAGGGDGVPRPEDAGVEPAEVSLWPPIEAGVLAADAPFAISLLPEVAPQDAWQVRIEQRMTIRISPPRASVPMPDMFFGMPTDGGVEFAERKMGNCLPASGIVSVRPDRGNRLLLFMRDRRVVSAELARSCRARDFYSGFLIERNEDGRVCVDRDTLLSRSGMSCTLTRIRQLVEQDR